MVCRNLCLKNAYTSCHFLSLENHFETMNVKCRPVQWSVKLPFQVEMPIGNPRHFWKWIDRSCTYIESNFFYIEHNCTIPFHKDQMLFLLLLLSPSCLYLLVLEWATQNSKNSLSFASKISSLTEFKLEIMHFLNTWTWKSLKNSKWWKLNVKLSEIPS